MSGPDQGRQYGASSIPVRQRTLGHYPGPTRVPPNQTSLVKGSEPPLVVKDRDPGPTRTLKTGRPSCPSHCRPDTLVSDSLPHPVTRTRRSHRRCHSRRPTRGPSTQPPVPGLVHVGGPGWIGERLVTTRSDRLHRVRPRLWGTEEKDPRRGVKGSKETDSGPRPRPHGVRSPRDPWNRRKGRRDRSRNTVLLS